MKWISLRPSVPSSRPICLAHFMDCVFIVPLASFTFPWSGREGGRRCAWGISLTPAGLDSPRASCSVLLEGSCSEVSAPLPSRNVTPPGSVHRKCDCVIESLQALCALMVSAGHNPSFARWIFFQREHGERLPVIVPAKREQQLSTCKVGSWPGMYPCWPEAAKLAMRASINEPVAPRALDFCLIFKAEHIVPKKDNLWLPSR